MTTVIQPFPFFADLGGDPLDEGYIYIGLPNQNPETSPKQAYWDAALTIPATQPLRTLEGYIARNGAPARVFVNGEFSMTVRNRRSSLVYTLLAVDSFVTYAELAMPSGAAAVGCTADISGATDVQEFIDYTEIRLDDSRRADIRQSNSAATNAAELVAAMQGRYDAGGGSVVLPGGDYNITTAAFNYGAATTVNVLGAGVTATTLRKSGGGTDPVINLASSPGVLEVYSEFTGFQVIGSSIAPGIRATRLARFVMRQLRIQSASVGFDNLGSLVFSAYDCTIQANGIGYRSRKSSDNIRANLIQFQGGQISANTSFGMDVGDAAGVSLRGTDLSANGTAADLGTGAIMLRSTMDDETGFSTFNMDGGWLEANQGWALQTEACAGLSLNLRGVFAASNVSGKVANIGAIFNSYIEGLVAGAASDEVNIAAARSTVVGGVIGVLNDTSTRVRHLNVSTTAAEIPDTFKSTFKRHKLATVDHLVGQASQIVGGDADTLLLYQPSGEIAIYCGSGAQVRAGSNTLGFYGATPVVKQTGVAVSAAALHAALVNLGLISA